MAFVRLSARLRRACIVIIGCTLARILVCGWIVQCSGTLMPKHVHLLPAVFFQFHLEKWWGMDKCKLGVISQKGLKIEVKLLTVRLSANRKSYMPHRLAQQPMTFSDLEWPFHDSSVPSVWDTHAHTQACTADTREWSLIKTIA